MNPALINKNIDGAIAGLAAWRFSPYQNALELTVKT